MIKKVKVIIEKVLTIKIKKTVTTKDNNKKIFTK